MAKQRVKEIKRAVQEKYGKIAQAGSSCCGPATAEAQERLARRKRRAAELYGEEVTARLPDSVIGATAGCGNPTAIAALQPGQVVLDLGSGGGIDCFLAADMVGAKGRVIGVDMTPEMVALARENARKLGTGNVEFRLGEMEHLPLESDSVDVVLSNCVINLSPDKDAVFREAFRVLKRGGRLAISDIVLTEDLPQEVQESYEAWAGCVAGALRQHIYLDKIRAAGFSQVTVDSAKDFHYQGHTLKSILVSAVKASD
jgi:SAM-dependent methyltransferase